MKKTFAPIIAVPILIAVIVGGLYLNKNHNTKISIDLQPLGTDYKTLGIGFPDDDIIVKTKVPTDLITVAYGRNEDRTISYRYLNDFRLPFIADNQHGDMFMNLWNNTEYRADKELTIEELEDYSFREIRFVGLPKDNRHEISFEVVYSIPAENHVDSFNTAFHERENIDDEILKLEKSVNDNEAKVLITKTQIETKSMLSRNNISYQIHNLINVNDSYVRITISLVSAYDIKLNDFELIIDELFNRLVFVEKGQLPRADTSLTNDGEQIYTWVVNPSLFTHGNSIFPGTRLDIVVRAVKDGKIIMGKLLENVEVIAVRDSVGRNISINDTRSGTPATILFACPEDICDVLKQSENIKVPGFELFLAIPGVDIPSELFVSIEILIDFIKSNQ